MINLQNRLSPKKDTINKIRPVSAYLYLSNNERILGGHQKIQDFWRRQEDLMGKKVGRKENEVGILGEERGWRVKKEVEEVLEVIKTEKEKLGEKCWEIRLRKYDENVIRRDKKTFPKKN